MASDPILTQRENAAYSKALDIEIYRERVLTEALGWMLARDLAAAGGFARTVVSLLRPDLPAPPPKLLCKPEAPIHLGLLRGYRERRADLLFGLPAAPTC